MSFSKKLSKLAQLPQWLNWLLSVVEPLIVLAITFVIGYAAYWLVFGLNATDKHTRMIQAMEVINNNWKVALIVLLLLFYRTVRIFIEQAEELWIVKRKKPMVGEQQEQPNPQEKP